MLGENVERNEEHLGREGVEGNALCAGAGRVGWGGWVGRCIFQTRKEQLTWSRSPLKSLGGIAGGG